MPSKALVSAVCSKISMQFPDSPEGKVNYAVVERAIYDLFEQERDRETGQATNPYRDEALRYLNGSIPHAELCGVDASWIKRVLKQAGVLEGAHEDIAA